MNRKTQEGVLTIDVRALPHGIYFLKVEDENGAVYFKVAVVH
jgi:hypothetical protein